MQMHFPIADITCNPMLPFCVAVCISFFTSMAGLSGAFLLLPFQMSVLGFVGPSVSATNHFFNIVAAPAGVYRYWREGRFIWPITKTIALGTLPGVFIGAFVRIKLLPRTESFKIFAGAVLILIGIKVTHTLYEMLFDDDEDRYNQPKIKDAKCTVVEQNTTTIALEFCDSTYTVSKRTLIALSFVVGIIGGIYGIGGGAIMSPFLVSMLGLPIYIVAGATLAATALTSFAGVAFFWMLSPISSSNTASPDWLLGLLLGFGGMCGMYLGAKFQKYVPAYVLQSFLMTVLFGTGFLYIIENIQSVF